MVPTKRFWLLIALGIPIASMAGILGAPSIAIAYNLFLIGAAYASFRLGPSARELKIKRTFDPVLSVRVPNRIAVGIVNEGVEPIQAQLRDEPPPLFTASQKQFSISLASGDETTISYQLTPYDRGTDYFRGTFLKIKCPLGLVDKVVKLNTEQPIRVYPNVLALREFDLLKQKGQLKMIGIRQSRTRGLGSDFESLREYTEGDDFRKIDWKASARRGKLVVRQFEQERNQPVIITIDVGRRMLAEVEGVLKLDHTLDSLLMLVHAALMAGDFVGLLVYSDTVKRYIPPRKGRNQAGIIIEAIHDLIAEPVESDPVAAFSYLATRWKRRSLLVSFSDVEDSEEAKNLAAAIGPIARRHLMLLARVADPRLHELVDQPIKTEDDLYKKASALLFTSERKQAGSTLSASGIHTLEAEPQELAAALVSFYFMVKERSLL